MIRSPCLVIAIVVFTGAYSMEARAQGGANVLQNTRPEHPDLRQTETDQSLKSSRVALTADALQGPLTPHMAATWNTRYALMSALRMLERAVGSSDSHAEGYYHVITDQMWRQVRLQDESFELALGTILHEPQLQRYRTWMATWHRGTQVQQRLGVALVRERPKQTESF